MIEIKHDKSLLLFLKVALAITIAGFIWVIFSIYTTNFNINPKENSLIAELNELQERIIYLDEVLTMSANMFVQTGNEAWGQRYEENVPILIETLNRALELVPDLSEIEGASQTVLANNALVEMEERAFLLVGSDQQREAQDLLASEEYAQQKQIYADGMNKFRQGINEAVTKTYQARRKSNSFQMLAVASIATIIGLGWLWVLKTVQLWKKNLEDASEKYSQVELSAERSRAALAVEKSRAALAAEKHKARVAAQKSEKTLSLITENTNDIITLRDAEARVLYVSPSFERHLGRRPDEHIGTHSETTPVHPDEAETLKTWKREVFKEGKRFIDVFRVKAKNGKYVWFQSETEPIRDNNGKVTGAVTVSRNFTKQKEAETKLFKVQEKLAETNKDLEQFAYAASHDLKTPLKGINTLAGWIQKDLGKSLKGKPAENLKRLRLRVKRLETLLDDMLAYSMAGRENTKLTRVNLNKEIQGFVDLLNIPKSFNINVANKLPTVMAPKGTLEQIFSNLINNAIKHHDRDEGIITISSKKIKVDQKEMWEFSVADDGPGIKPKYQEKIFNLFQTLESKDDVEGSGMGLAIVKRLVNRQSGNLGVHSEGTGKGTVFKFTWNKI